MEIPQIEIASILAQYNPWWRGESIPDLSPWRRASFAELRRWIFNPPAHRAVLLSGARQVGKTTLMLQAIRELIQQGVPPANILYATFDHPIAKLAGLDAVIEAWRSREPKAAGEEYLFLDEAQFIRDWGVWIKHQVDFSRHRRIVFTGSAMPLLDDHQESGVGRWHTLRLTTLSFYEYLQLRKITTPPLPSVRSLRELYTWDSSQRMRVSDQGRELVAHFHEYLLRGGFPQTAQIESISQAQRLLREDIVDKVLKRDMTALFGVRQVLDLERVFLYLCMHDGGILDMKQLCSNLEVKRPTAERYIDLFEKTHLLYKLSPLGYGKEVLRGRVKTYLADASIAPSVLLRGKELLGDPTALGIAAEAAVLKHLYTRYYPSSVRFSYWQGKRSQEVDLVAETGGELIPFEIKYRSQPVEEGEVKGLKELCRQKEIGRGYVITRLPDDFGPLDGATASGAAVMKIPAPLCCYWLGESELSEDR